LLKELNPNFENTFQKTIERVSGAVEINRLYLENFKSTAIRNKDGSEWIDIQQLKKHHHAAVLLWELMKSNGFNYDQCRDIINTTQPGKQFLSGTHRLIVDRDFLIVNKRNQNEIFEILIESHDVRASNGCDEISILRNDNGDTAIDNNPSVALLDASKITYPLRWRRWQPGDAFKPLGMTTNKKLSDFLIDVKTPASEKDKVTVLESAGRIIWVVGMRISDDVKIAPSTTASIVLKVVKTEAEKIS
jgi:tRNA(Ile)-lysidine synthase